MNQEFHLRRYACSMKLMKHRGQPFQLSSAQKAQHQQGGGLYKEKCVNNIVLLQAACFVGDETACLVTIECRCPPEQLAAAVPFVVLLSPQEVHCRL